MNKAELRSIYRNRRRSLTPQQQRLAAHNLARQIAKLPQFTHINQVALYFASDGEISPQHIAVTARARGKTTWYPVLRRQHMFFREYNGKTKLMRNRYGIAEPLPRQRMCAGDNLDLVLLPLVAFDRTGGRLGMGGGFYDRTFAFKQRTPHTKPVLVGLAHALQEHDDLTLESWDIPLDYIVTEREIIKPRHRSI